MKSLFQFTLFCFTLFLSCTGRKNIEPVPKENSGLDTLFSPSIKKEISRYIKSEKPSNHQLNLFTGHVKSYANISTLYLIRNPFNDTLLIRKANAYFFLDNSLVLIFNGYSDLLFDSTSNQLLIDSLKSAGANFNWDGTTKHYEGRKLYLFNGDILKIDTVSATNENFLPLHMLTFNPPNK